MTTQSEITLVDLYKAIEGNSEEIDRAHGRLDGIEGVLIAMANHLRVDVDYLPESKVINLKSRHQDA